MLFIKLSGFELTTWCQKPTQSLIALTEHGIIPNSPRTAKCGTVLLTPETYLANLICTFTGWSKNYLDSMVTLSFNRVSKHIISLQ